MIKTKGMERKIGEKFTDNGVLLEVVKGRTCDGCYYEADGLCPNNYQESGTCFWHSRTDRKGVIFKQVEEKQ